MTEEQKKKITEKIPEEKMRDPETFKQEAIGFAIENLETRGLIKNSQEKEILKEVYKEDKRTIEEIFNEIDNLKRNDIVSKTTTTISTKISMENIVDMKKDGKNYIVITYPYPREEMKMVENYSKLKASQIFENAKDASGLADVTLMLNEIGSLNQNSKDPKDASTELGDDVVNDRHEVQLRDFAKWIDGTGNYPEPSNHEIEIMKAAKKFICKEIAQGNRTKETECLKKDTLSLLKEYNKKIVLAPSEDIVMVCSKENNTIEKTLVVRMIDNEYKLVPIDANEYEYESSKEENDVPVDTEETEIEKNNKEKKIDSGTSYQMKRPKDKREAA